MCMKRMIAFDSEITLLFIREREGGSEIWTSLFRGAEEFRTFSDIGGKGSKSSPKIRT